MDGYLTDSRSPLPEAPSPAGAAQVNLSCCLCTNTTSHVNGGGPGQALRVPGTVGVCYG